MQSLQGRNYSKLFGDYLIQAFPKVEILRYLVRRLNSSTNCGFPAAPSIQFTNDRVNKITNKTIILPKCLSDLF